LFLDLAGRFDGVILEVAMRALERFEKDIAEEGNSQEEDSGFALLDGWYKSITTTFIFGGAHLRPHDSSYIGSPTA
jgi:hypothetical protein